MSLLILMAFLYIYGDKGLPALPSQYDVIDPYYVLK